MSVNNNYPTPSKAIEVSIKFLTDIANILRNAMQGKTNNTGEFDLETSGTTTTVKNILCNENSVIILSAGSALGASAGAWITAGDQEFTVTHSVNAGARPFRYVIIG